MYLGASLSALAGLIAFLGRDALQEVAEEANRQSVNPLTQEQLETGISGLVGTYVIVAIASFLLWIWMASANGAGKSWARTTSVVLTVLGFVYAAVAAIFFGTTALNLLVFLATIVVSIVILVLLYRPESSQYYAAQSRRI